MKSSGTKGCFLGGLLGAALFVALVAWSNEAPELGGVLIVPFFVLFFAAAGTLMGWLVGTPVSLSRPTRGDFAVWGRGCVLTLSLCALILLILAALGRYVTAR
jgi:hypothetical protein